MRIHLLFIAILSFFFVVPSVYFYYTHDRAMPGPEPIRINAELFFCAHYEIPGDKVGGIDCPFAPEPIVINPNEKYCFKTPHDSLLSNTECHLDVAESTKVTITFTPKRGAPKEWYELLPEEMISPDATCFKLVLSEPARCIIAK